MRIAITIGDVNGIGPEVVLRTLEDARVRARVAAVLVGPASAWTRHRDEMGMNVPLTVVAGAAG
jgi:4-hydroxy-L-threonine phosphate dehydrogenase PdxA